MEPLVDRLVGEIQERGPITVAAFMERALYDAAGGYYTAGRRSGARGDFYTSVDAGPAFGHLVSRQIARMWHTLGQPGKFDLVEAGASSGRLMRDVLDAMAAEAPPAYEAARVTLVERSEAARAEHGATLAPHASRLAASTGELPPRIDGVLFANELLDALPVHRVVFAPEGPREVYVAVREGRLVPTLGPVSTGRIEEHFELVGAAPAPGTVADVGLAAVAWVRDAARVLASGYLVLVDYGHEARQLYDPSHPDGTLRAYYRHMADAPAASGGADRPAWLERPGEQDLTAHVDFTAVRKAGELEGLHWLGRVPQGRWLLGLGLGELLERAAGTSVANVRDRLRLKTLVLPGGPGTTHHVLVMARGEGLTFEIA